MLLHALYRRRVSLILITCGLDPSGGFNHNVRFHLYSWVKFCCSRIHSMCALGITPKRGGVSHTLPPALFMSSRSDRQSPGQLVSTQTECHWVTAWVEYQQHKDRQAFETQLTGNSGLRWVSRLMSVKNDVIVNGLCMDYLLWMGYIHWSLCVVYWGEERGWTLLGQYLAEGLFVIGCFHCVISLEGCGDAFKGVSAVQWWTKADWSGCLALLDLSPLSLL